MNRDVFFWRNGLFAVLALLTIGAAAPKPGAEAPGAAGDAEQWLARIEAAAEGVQTLESTVWWITENALVGDRQYRQGRLLYQSNPARFSVTFDKRRAGDRIDDIDHTLIFTGRTLIERKGGDRIIHVYELAPEGEEASLDATDGGPFILPLNLQKDRVLERFDVAVRPLGEDAPADAAVRLHLEPRDDVDDEVLPMDIWFGGEHLLPLRVQSEDIDADELTEFQLRDPAVNVELPAETFEFTAPTDPGWQVELHPLGTSGPGDADER